MNLLINELNNTVLQIAVLVGIPFVFYFINNRSPKGFFHWIGLFVLKPVPYKAIFIVFILFGVLSFLPTGYLFLTHTMTESGYYIESFKETGWSIYTVLIIGLWAIFQTSLTEEVLFRGFIIRLFSEKNSHIGNLVQAGVYGIIHVLGFFGKDIIVFLLVFFITAFAGYLLGWLSLNKSGRSILYCWIIHAIINILSAVINLKLVIE